jgi:hypothetical protein
MSNKENKFEPSNGLKVAVHFNIIAIRAVAQELDIFPEVLAEKLDRAGEDMALIQNEELHKDLSIVQAKVLATRANTNRLKMQVDIARSVGTSVRTSMDLT